jgi:hypothetical protein
MSAFDCLSASFLVPSKDLEIGDEAKHESDICYAAAGPVGLISKRFSRPSNNRLDDDTADRVLNFSGQRTPILGRHWLPRSSEPSMGSI